MIVGGAMRLFVARLLQPCREGRRVGRVHVHRAGRAGVHRAAAVLPLLPSGAVWPRQIRVLVTVGRGRVAWRVRRPDLALAARRSTARGALVVGASRVTARAVVTALVAGAFVVQAHATPFLFAFLFVRFARECDEATF